MNIKFTRKVTSEEQAKFLECFIGPRYLEDADINGNRDTEDGEELKQHLPNCVLEGENIPKPMQYGTEKDLAVRILINIDNGKVVDWPRDVTASFHYKSCDINVFRLLDKNMNVIYETPGGETEYVMGPDFMNEYGDYFVLGVDAEGFIIDYDKDEMEYEIKHWIKFHENDD